MVLVGSRWRANCMLYQSSAVGLSLSSRESRIFSADINRLMMIFCFWTLPLYKSSKLTWTLSLKFSVIEQASKCLSSSTSIHPLSGQRILSSLYFDLNFLQVFDILPRKRKSCFAWLVLKHISDTHLQVLKSLRAIWTLVITLQESRYPRLPYSSPDIRDYLSGVRTVLYL